MPWGSFPDEKVLIDYALLKQIRKHILSPVGLRPETFSGTSPNTLQPDPYW